MKFSKGDRCDVIGRRTMFKAVLVMSLSLMAVPAMAALDGRDIIGPHEYDLPTNFKPFNVFVQYGDVDNSGNQWDSTGNKVAGPHTQQVVGLSKYVRFWVPDWAPSIGLAYEGILPEVGVRTPATATMAGSSAGGISDPLTGPAIWFRPVNTTDFSITLGQDFLLQVPIGDSAVGGGDVWHLNSAFLYNVNYYKWNFVGDIGVIEALSDSGITGTHPGMKFYFDSDLSYQVLPHLAPFVGVTYETNGSTDVQAGSTATPTPRNHEMLISGGVYIPTFPNQSITLRYSRGVSGENHAATNELGFKYVYAW